MSWVVVSETLRRHATNVGYVAYVILLAMAGVAVAQFERPGAVWPGLVTLLAIIIGCTPIGPEFSSGTLQLILVKPVSRAVYLVSRVAGVVLAVWSGALIAALAELIARGFSEFNPIAISFLNSLAGTLLIVSLLTFFGSFLRAYFNVATYFLLQIFLGALIGIGARKFPAGVTRAITTVMQNVFPDAPPRLEAAWLLMVTCNAAIALVLACLIFRRREVPYGAE